MCCAFTYLSSLNASTFSHIYRAPKRELIIMIPSNAHEHTIQTVAEPVRSAMSAQRAQNPELGEYWTMHHNKAATYEEALDGSVEFQPDIGIYHNNDCQLPIEITFTWGSGPLLRMACTSPMRVHWFLCKMTQTN